MNDGIINKVNTIWKRDVVRRVTMFSAPNKYVEKSKIFDFQKEICRRSQLSFNDIRGLSEPIADGLFYANTIDSSEALYYGALQVLLDYADLSSISMPPLRTGIQHGYVFEIRDWEKSKLEKRNLVWSKKLVDMYHQFTSNPDVYPIGAAFFYAKSLLNEEQCLIEKKRLGKNLLAFPMHSQSHVDANYNPNRFLNILKEERNNFDTVRVCMYWKDILRGTHKVFEEAGFECVCNGHLYDPYFLRRQKTLFELADATISNGVGSHIGYSLFMKKPHWLIDDDYEYVNSRKGGDAKDLTDVSKSESFNRVKDAFLNNPDYLITQRQREVIDDFWGISDIKSPDEIRDLFFKLYSI